MYRWKRKAEARKLLFSRFFEILSYVAVSFSINQLLNSTCGHELEKIETNKFESRKKLYDYLISTKHFLLEELIQQSEDLSILHPNSVNTVRMTTILTQNGPIVFHLYFRIGQGGKLVDNISSGAIIVKVDPSTGVLCTDGVDAGNNLHTKHPDSDIHIKGYKLPEWDKALQLVKVAALVLPSNRYVGWDLAHTNKGWIIVEANARGQFFGQQMADKVGKKREMDKIMKSL